MSIQPHLQLGRNHTAPDGDTDQAIEDLKEIVQKNLTGYGTAAPTSSTAGQVYYQYDSSGSTATRVWVKVGADWR